MKIQISQETACFNGVYSCVDEKRTDKFMIKQYKLRFYNFKLVILLTAISLFGVQLVASASPDLRNKQLLGVVMGLVLLVILSLMDYSWILNFQWIMYGFQSAYAYWCTIVRK